MHCYRFAVRGILVAEGGAGRGDQLVAGNPVVTHDDRCCCRAIVNFIDASKAQVQTTLGDIGDCCSASIDDGIVAGVRTRQAGILYRYRLAILCILVAEGGAGRSGQLVAGNPVVTQND